MKTIVNFYTIDGVKHYINMNKFIDISFEKRDETVDIIYMFILMEGGSNLSCEINKANYDSLVEQLCV